MDVILHFGAHRTATTTFQRMMGQNGVNLRASGFAYWGPKRTRSALFDGVLGPAAGSFPWSAQKGSRAAGRIGLALDELEGTGSHSLLISEENMIGTLRQTLATSKLYPDAFGRALRLSRVMGARCKRIGLGIRSYDEWWASVIAFSVAKAGPTPSDELTATLLRQPRRWRDVIGDLFEAFPDAELVVWRYEELAGHPDFVARALLGMDLPAMSGAGDWHNASPTPAAMRGHLSDLGEPVEGVIDHSGRFMPFDAAQQRELQAMYSDDIAWLRNQQEMQITYLDDPGKDPVATGPGRGQLNDGDGFENRHLA